MLKAIGLFLILIGGAGSGYAFSTQLSSRYAQLKELQRMTALLIGEISYGNTPLPEGLAQVGKRLNEPFAGFLKELSEELKKKPQETLEELFAKHVKTDLKHSCLKPGDLEALLRMSSSLGYLDRDMQLRNLRLYETEVQQEITDTYASMPGKKKMYQTLGIMGGLFLVILLI